MNHVLIALSLAMSLICGLILIGVVPTPTVSGELPFGLLLCTCLVNAYTAWQNLLIARRLSERTRIVSVSHAYDEFGNLMERTQIQVPPQ
jgi:hypothetical protein